MEKERGREGRKEKESSRNERASELLRGFSTMVFLRRYKVLIEDSERVKLM